MQTFCTHELIDLILLKGKYSCLIYIYLLKSYQAHR